MTYLLDANVFIEAKNRHYGFDFCPGFWAWLDDAHARSRLFSVAKVGEELRGGRDELATWAKDRDSLFLQPDDAVAQSLRVLVTWVTTCHPRYQSGAISAFLQAGDSFLVAHAHAYGYTVVTHEVYADTIKRVKIPNACKGVDIDYVDLFTMLRREGARLVL